MEKTYGAEAFAQMWEAWVDGISHFAKRSKGTEVTLSHIRDANEVVKPLWVFFFFLIFFLSPETRGSNVKRQRLTQLVFSANVRLVM